MPTYSYACRACTHSFDVVQSFTDPALTDCPQCNGSLRKVFHPVGVVFKGDGFYRTDSRSQPTSTNAETSADASNNTSDTSDKPDTSSGTDTAGKTTETSSSSTTQSAPKQDSAQKSTQHPTKSPQKNTTSSTE